MERIVFRASKRPFFKHFLNKTFPTNRRMYMLYQEDDDQLWSSSAKFLGQIDRKQKSERKKGWSKK